MQSTNTNNGNTPINYALLICSLRGLQNADKIATRPWA